MRLGKGERKAVAGERAVVGHWARVTVFGSGLAVVLGLTGLRGDEAALLKKYASQAQQQVEERERELEALKPQFSKKEAEARALNVAEGLRGNDNLFRFKRIEIEGSTWMPKGEQRRQVQRFEGRDLSLSELQKLIDGLTGWYIERGYSTTRVGVNEASFKEAGCLKILVQEGRVGAVKLLENGKPRKRYNTVVPLMSGKPFQLRAFEQGMDTLQRLPSLSVQMDVAPTAVEGESDVILNIEKRKPIQFSGGYDNEGSPTYGERAMAFGATLDDILGVYDLWYINYHGNRKLYKDRYNESVQGLFSVPWGKHLWTVAFGDSKFLTTTQGQLQTIEFKGRTQTLSFDWDYTLDRTSVSKTQLGWGLTHKRIRNEIQGQRQLTGCRNLTTLQLKLSHLHRVWGGWASGTLGFTRGLRCNHLSGATILPTAFKKWSCDLSYLKPLPRVSERLQWSLQASGQYSRHMLYGSETMSLGGPSSVRGFSESVLSGENVGYVRNELRYRLGALLGVTHDLFAGYDVGKLFKNRTALSDEAKKNLRGAAVGWRFKGDYIHGECTLSKALTGAEIGKGRILFHFKLGYQF